MPQRTPVTAHLIALTMAAGLTLTTPLHAADADKAPPASASDVGVADGSGVNIEQAPPLNEILPLDDLRAFVDVFTQIKVNYVEDVDDRTLLRNAIRGMLSGLDPHSSYLEPTAFDDLQESTSGEFGGLGLEVGLEDGFVKVVTPIDDTPAEKAGVKAQDVIIKLDDRPVKGLTLGEAVALMRGKPGTEIKLTIIREGLTEPLELIVVRDVISVTSVKHRIIEPGYGYVRITQFQAKTGLDLVQALEKVEQASDMPLKGLVLDLRNNPGGVLQAAVDVADAFLDEGLIVYTEGRHQNAQLSYSATEGDVLAGIPVVVLINGGSASASEIVAGALQDHSRAVIMGSDSFGKGSVQTVLEINEEYGLKLTTARYFTPSGRSIQALGISPDIEVNPAKVTALESNPFAYKEADLARHLENGDDDETASDSIDDETIAAQRELLNSDFQLNEALNLLKGLSILRKTMG